uniref:hypothetical protein n=1 Tax=Bacillus subtilis TaxID=1423 RepID=UPI001642986F
FAVEELEVFREWVCEMWVYVELKWKKKGGDLIEKVDIEVCDEDGMMWVGVKGFWRRVMEGDIEREG